MADYNELFKLDSSDKQMTITSGDGIVITNEELHGNEFELTESLCSEDELKFGSCESSSIKFKISYTRNSLKNKWLTVNTSINQNEPYQYGIYKVESDIPTADRQFREITAFDVMHDVLNKNVAVWYNSIFPGDNSRVSGKELRDSFFEYFGITQETTYLPQDNIYFAKTIDPSQLAGKLFITSFCEINGCFGHIDRDGTFRYIFLSDLDEEVTEVESDYYISAKYEDYEVQKIDSIKVRENDEEIYSYNDGSNPYFIIDNFLIYGKADNELNEILSNVYPIISKVWYRPTSARFKGNPTIEVGTGIRLETAYETINTYVLERTLKGIQALFDEVNASGTEYYGENLNSMGSQFQQLLGKINQVDNDVFRFNTVENLRGVNIGDGELKRILRATIITKPNAQVKIEVELQLNIELIEEKAIGSIIYVLDSNELERKPIETWSVSGEHILQLMNFLTITDAGFHIFDLYMKIDDGTAELDGKDALVIFTGSGLVGNVPFNGRIEIEETIDHGFALNDIVLGGNYDEGVVAAIQAPISISLADASNGFALHDIGFDGNVVDEVAFGDSISELTWGEAHDYTWAAAYARFHWGYIQD